MDNSFEFPASSTAVLAAGATLVAICVAIWKQRKNSNESNADDSMSDKSSDEIESPGNESLIELPHTDFPDLKKLAFRDNLLDIDGRFSGLYCERVFRRKKDISKYFRKCPEGCTLIHLKEVSEFKRSFKSVFQSYSILRYETRISVAISKVNDVSISQYILGGAKWSKLYYSRCILKKGFLGFQNVRDLEHIVKNKLVRPVLPDVIPLIPKIDKNSINEEGNAGYLIQSESVLSNKNTSNSEFKNEDQSINAEVSSTTDETNDIMSVLRYVAENIELTTSDYVDINATMISETGINCNNGIESKEKMATGVLGEKFKIDYIDCSRPIYENILISDGNTKDSSDSKKIEFDLPSNLYVNSTNNSQDLDNNGAFIKKESRIINRICTTMDGSYQIIKEDKEYEDFPSEFKCNSNTAEASLFLDRKKDLDGSDDNSIIGKEFIFGRITDKFVEKQNESLEKECFSFSKEYNCIVLDKELKQLEKLNLTEQIDSETKSQIINENNEEFIDENHKLEKNLFLENENVRIPAGKNSQKLCKELTDKGDFRTEDSSSKKFLFLTDEKREFKGKFRLKDKSSFEAEIRGIFGCANLKISSELFSPNINPDSGPSKAREVLEPRPHASEDRQAPPQAATCSAKKTAKATMNNSKSGRGIGDGESAVRSIARDVTAGSRDSVGVDGALLLSPAQMDRLTTDGAVFVESSVTTRVMDDSVIVSCLTLDDSGIWSSEVDTSIDEGVTVTTMDEGVTVRGTDEGVTVTTTTRVVSDYRPDAAAQSRPSRLMGLLHRDEERRAKSVQERSQPSSIDYEWERILSDVLASVSELERYGEERRRRDVTTPEDAEKRMISDQSHPTAMEGEALSPEKTGETPTKVKNLRFKLDPDVFDVPSDDSFYDDEDNVRPSWRRGHHQKYRVEIGDEPVQLVSVHASVVPAGQKNVARPVGIDLHVRLTEEKNKRTHVGTSPSQVKRRSPVNDPRMGWCNELSPVTENVDWRDTFTPVVHEAEPKPVLNGILKTPSPKVEAPLESANPFKGEIPNGNHVPKPPPLTNGVPKRPERKLFSLPKKKFVPDPEAIDRITGYKVALSKPPLPPPIGNKLSLPPRISRAELARKQYLDSKAALSAPKMDGSKKFQQFLSQAQNDRARIVSSVPDFSLIEKAVREKWEQERSSSSPRVTPPRDDISRSGDSTSSRGSTPDDAWSSYVQSCRKYLGRRSQSMTYLETDVDLPVEDDKWCSTSALNNELEIEPVPLGESEIDTSREDVDENGRTKSEHELRIQRSLQSLPVPDWYKNTDKPKSGFLLGSGHKEKRGWAAAKSLASSTSSLSSVGLKKPICSLRSSRENIPWSRSSSSPDGPALSLALSKAFREPYLGWRSRTYTTSSGVSSSPRTSPPSWCAATTDEEANEVSFDGEDAFGPVSSPDDHPEPVQPPSPDDTAADVTTVSMDTGELIKMPCGEDTCEDINNMSMETCEIVDSNVVPEVPSPTADNTGDDIDNLSTDTTEGTRKSKRYSYSQSIYHSEWDLEEESRGDRKMRSKDGDENRDHKVIWIESSFVGSRTTTSIMVLPEDRRIQEESSLERPASR